MFMKNKIKEADVLDMINGFSYDTKTGIYTCLFCDKQYEAGDIYSVGKRLLSAEKAMRFHIVKEHGNVFEALLGMDKAQTGLTDTQGEFLKNEYNSVPDREIAEIMNISPSTVRYQRYNFREKVRQAKLLLALNELMEKREKTAEPVKPLSESDAMGEALFSSLSPLKLITFDFKKGKDKKRLFILNTIIKEFEKGRKYSEKEISAVLKEIYHDYAMLRRFLVEGGFMKRTDDGKEYWVS
jgi:hypothetical protein